MKIFLLLLLTSSFAMMAQGADTISGAWTYRSFHNNPQLVGDDPTKIANLLFGEGVLQVTLNQNNTISGTINFGSNYVLDISGTLQNGMITLAGSGRSGTPTSGWLYEYKAYLAPTWSHAVNQRPTLVGTVIRTRHEPAPAGYTATFIMVKQ